MENIALWLEANTWVFIPIMIWDLVWRLLALWHSARQNQKVWFVALMVVNSVGILPLVYLIFVSKTKFWVKETEKAKVQEAVIVKKKK